VTLKPGETYTARLKCGICDLSNNCTRQDTVWKFIISKDAAQASGDSSIPQGFRLPENKPAIAPPRRDTSGKQVAKK